MIWLVTKKIQPVVTKLFIRHRELNITKSYFAVPKNVSLNSTLDFIMKFSNKR